MEQKLSEAKNQMQMAAMVTALVELLVDKGIIIEAELTDKTDKVLKELLEQSRSQLSDDDKILWDYMIKKMFGGDDRDK